MKIHFSSFMLLFLVSIAIFAQDNVPYMQSKIVLTVKKGTIECNLTLSNMPRLANYFLRLNSGVNIGLMKNAEGTSPLQYQKIATGHTFFWQICSILFSSFNSSGKWLHHSIGISYVGKYPVIIRLL